MKLGLVLEGGAMRGVFTAGILDVFLERGIEFDECYAVSAGACLACSFLCKQKGRGYAVMTDYLDNPDYCSLSSLLRTGDLFGADFLYRKIPEELYPIDNKAFLAGNTRFWSVITDCETGKAEYAPVEDMMRHVDWVRASSSLPLVSRTVKIDGKEYLDGGIADPIPVKRALDAGCDKIVVILTRHRSFRKSKEKSLSLIRLKYRKYPNLVQSMKVRHEVYNNTLDTLPALEKEGKVFVFAPEEPLKIGRTEKDLFVLRQGYESGRTLAEDRFPALMKYLEW